MFVDYIWYLFYYDFRVARIFVNTHYFAFGFFITSFKLRFTSRKSVATVKVTRNPVELKNACVRFLSSQLESHKSMGIHKSVIYIYVYINILGNSIFFVQNFMIFPKKSNSMIPSCLANLSYFTKFNLFANFSTAVVL